MLLYTLVTNISYQSLKSINDKSLHLDKRNNYEYLNFKTYLRRNMYRSWLTMAHMVSRSRDSSLFYSNDSDALPCGQRYDGFPLLTVIASLQYSCNAPHQRHVFCIIDEGDKGDLCLTGMHKTNRQIVHFLSPLSKFYIISFKSGLQVRCLKFSSIWRAGGVISFSHHFKRITYLNKNLLICDV